jgi:hypothetical protein
VDLLGILVGGPYPKLDLNPQRMRGKMLQHNRWLHGVYDDRNAPSSGYKANDPNLPARALTSSVVRIGKNFRGTGTDAPDPVTLPSVQRYHQGTALLAGRIPATSAPLVAAVSATSRLSPVVGSASCNAQRRIVQLRR